MDDENETYDGCLTYTWIHEQVLNMGYKCSLNKIRTILKNIDYGRWAKSPNCDLTEVQVAAFEISKRIAYMARRQWLGWVLV